jgi:hypothetical protein
VTTSSDLSQAELKIRIIQKIAKSKTFTVFIIPPIFTAFISQEFLDVKSKKVTVPFFCTPGRRCLTPI